MPNAADPGSTTGVHHDNNTTASAITNGAGHCHFTCGANGSEATAGGDDGRLSLDEILDILGRTDGEHTAMCQTPVDGLFSSEVVLSRHVGEVVLPHKACVWFSINPTSGPERKRSGRGKESAVTRWAALYLDLDVKPGAFQNLEQAYQFIAALSGMIGTRPSVVIHSGHGLQPLWVIEDGQLDSSEKWKRAYTLTRRFGRLAYAVCIKHFGHGVDTVSDMSRVLRVPGTKNHKDPEHPAEVYAERDSGGPLMMERIEEFLDEWAPEIDSDKPVVGKTATGSVVAEPIRPPQDWSYGQRDCDYVIAMVTPWNQESDRPKAGRHQWAMNRAVRLACAHRLGCTTEDGLKVALEHLEKTLARWCQVEGEPRYLHPAEIKGAYNWAMTKVATFTDEDTRAELGDHQHTGGGADTTTSTRGRGGGSRFFGRDGLRVRDLAEAVVGQVVCGVGEVDGLFYVYEHGVWLPNDGRIETQIVALLGNRYRNAHARNVLDLIRYSPHTARVSCGPVSNYVNVPNGMVRWADGTLLAHSPDYRSTVQLPVEYDTDAQCPRFEQFLTEVLPEDLYRPNGESPGLIWELIGYTIFSGNPLHLAVLFYGKGRNGKGVLIRVLKGLLGDRNCSTVSLHQLVENRFRAAKLFGKLANLAGDLDSRWLDNTATFKAITGGDTIQGEHKYGMPFDFTPWALPIYSANKAFGSADSSEGWVARWLVVPFPHCFIGREDRELDARLQTDSELRGILRRGVEALPVLMRRGRFTEPESVREAKTAFVVASDQVRAWLDEGCVIEFGAWTARKELHSAYWAQTSSDGSKQLSAREFYNRIEQVNGIRKAIHQGVRGFGGIRLRADSDPPPAAAREEGGAEGAV